MHVLAFYLSYEHAVKCYNRLIPVTQCSGWFARFPIEGSRQNDGKLLLASRGQFQLDELHVSL